MRVNGQVVTELGTKADPENDRIEAAGQVIREEEKKVYLLLHKPPGVVATMADPEGRPTLRNCLRGMPARVYPVGRLDFDATGLVFLTNDGDLAATMLRQWNQLQQVYYVKIKGRLSDETLELVAERAGTRLKPIRQPGATRGHTANFWYEIALRDSRRDLLRRVLFSAQHPVEKIKRIAIGPLTLEGLPQGRYRALDSREVEQLRRAAHRAAETPRQGKKTPERSAKHA